MVVVQLIGGLGNQLFQYAVAKSLAIEKKQKLYIDISEFETYNLHNYSLQHFNIDSRFYIKPNKYWKKITGCFQKRTFYKEKDFGFNQSLNNLSGDAIFLEGYFQSEKYFLKYEDNIRKDFTIKTPLKPITEDLIKKIKSINSVSIHIRRGDYLSNTLHNTSKEEFYIKAIEIIEKKVDNPVFFVFSDDMAWVKLNFTIKHEVVFVDFNDALSNFEDLKLMASCKHNIIANSSFSWWGAWLNNNKNKIVIAPIKWFNDDSINSKDVVPDGWLKI